MKKIVFASHNKNKVEEMKSLLKDLYEVISLTDIGCFDDIEETEPTIEGNAQLKANYITSKYNIDCFADDSGLLIDALNGAPGVYSARYAGEPKNDKNNLELVLKNLENHSNRKAHFKTVIALNLKGKHYLFEGSINGKITEQPKGENGFGYDPIFIANDLDKTFAEMDLQEKSKISHRGIAIQKLISFLETYHAENQ
nr:non-canonical purine NTP diphosphatase [uncultured Flavobacterium sp.]